VTDSGVNVVVEGLTSLDHVTLGELLGLGTLATDLTGHRDISSLGTSLHDEAKDTVTGTTDSKATEELVLEGLSLGLGAEATVGNTLSEDLNTSGGEVETLLDNGGHLADALTVLAKDVLGTCGLDNDLSASRGLTDLKTGITVLSKLTGEKLSKRKRGKGKAIVSIEKEEGNKLVWRYFKVILKTVHCKVLAYAEGVFNQCI
jgi:hypothetical protein